MAAFAFQNIRETGMSMSMIRLRQHKAPPGPYDVHPEPQPHGPAAGFCETSPNHSHVREFKRMKILSVW